MTDTPRPAKGRVSSLWRWLLGPKGAVGLFVLLFTAFAGGIVFWGGFNMFMEHTNTLEFCVSCHEMESTVFQEYKTSVHWSNASGVRAVCSDCHVPKDWTAKLVRKIQATGELFHHFAGTINTPEKFERERLRLAEHVWATMEATDSRECRNCHSFDAMDFHEQSRRASKEMEEAAAEGKTCIECHKGIAHNLPQGFGDDD